MEKKILGQIICTKYEETTDTEIKGSLPNILEVVAEVCIRMSDLAEIPLEEIKRFMNLIMDYKYAEHIGDDEAAAAVEQRMEGTMRVEKLKPTAQHVGKRPRSL